MVKLLRASLVFFVVLFVNCNVKSDDADTCLYPCHYIYDPLCGEDGSEFMFFGNDCFMNRHNECYGQSKFSFFNRVDTSFPDEREFGFSLSTDFTQTDESNCSEFAEYSR
jgi:hypothetical protein